MKNNNKDPLKPKEDVRIEDKETGFLETLKKVVNKNPKMKYTFDFSQFPDFFYLKNLPDVIKNKYNEISAYLDNVLEEGEVVHIIYPQNNEVVIENKSDIEPKKMNRIRTAIYDLAVYDKTIS